MRPTTLTLICPFSTLVNPSDLFKRLVGAPEQEFTVVALDPGGGVGRADERSIEIPGAVQADQLDFGVGRVQICGGILQRCVVEGRDRVRVEDAAVRFFQQAHHAKYRPAGGIYVHLPLT